ncbi:MFS transporter [Anabaena sp. FACHB-1237]|uniref:MFS transporter n=1 Tax=Anabaena sp. FACHB-1237 TaxID=2692769 RepID=UPI0016817A06|nr:MFS transporter [Anabaena sp. FACHB-1237]MBD2136912.1 MFS transporter [Anabaena sp. FACHB-1237]
MNNNINNYHNGENSNGKLDFTTKLSYGIGTLGQSMAGNMTAIFMLTFFTNVAGISPGLAGAILLIGKVWDAVNDPLIGWLSDQTKSLRWGRRLSWIVYGTIPFALFRFLQWLVPSFNQNQNSNVGLLFWYYVVIGIIAEALFTAVSLPYGAMTPELTQDYDERTSLNSFRFTFSIIGEISSLILVQIIFSHPIFTNLQIKNQYLLLAGIFSVVTIICLYWCVWQTRDRLLLFEKQHIHNQELEHIPFTEQLKNLWDNKPFLFVIIIFLCSWLGANITATIFPYFVIYLMKLPPSHIPQLMIVVQVTALIMLYCWSYLSKEYGRKSVYFLGIGIWIIASFGIFFLQPQQMYVTYLLCVMVGCGLSTAYLIPWSMITDVIDLDELNHGQRREGIFYGFVVFLQKLVLALGIFLVSYGLEISGFQAGTGETLIVQPESALLGIRLVISPLTMIFLILGLLVNYFYPLTREIHAEIMLQLKERHHQDNV